MHGTRRTQMAGLAVSLLLVAGAAACGDNDDKSSSTTTGAPASAAVTVSDAWCRTSPSSATAGACYLTITNDGASQDTLVSASVPTTVAAKTELHETVAADTGTTEAMGTAGTTAGNAMGGSGTTAMGGGSEMMQMQPVSSIPVPAGETVMLEPGGYHIMLLELASPLQTGSTVEITLTFEKSGTKTVSAEVRAN